MKNEVQVPQVFSDLKNLRLQDFSYELPDEKIAKYPVDPRDSSRLLHFHKGHIQDHAFHQLPEILPPHSLLIFNQTRVLPARLLLKRKTGASIEVLLLAPEAPNSHELALQASGTCVWKTMVGNKKRWKAGENLEKEIHLSGESFTLEVTWENREENRVRFSWDSHFHSFGELIQEIGAPPLPPYLNRGFEDSDWEHYQTVYAKETGAVAAPTAGLHFTQRVLDELEKKELGQAFVTLHVGAGTFAPIKEEAVAKHIMHEEYLSISLDVLQQLAHHTGPIIPVGTTSLRVIETAYWMGLASFKGGTIPHMLPQEFPYTQDPEGLPSYREVFSHLLEKLNKEKRSALQGKSQLYIMPGYPVRVASGILTNFHQPSSSLILLVAAILGPQWRKVYQHALAQNYRFLSYGDSSLLIP